MLVNSINMLKSCLSKKKSNELETIEGMILSEVPVSNPSAACWITTHAQDQKMGKSSKFVL